ncbi:YitT family protein [Paenalkalicoccus suaedae]|uniref:YitT family protein n=1 Tax=Paenalkalicoccus suaedae TaxID=2592382 RepID=A0A859FI07_9BACI|nr:YitT family protein [Paenalkalicoccus suaedae]QKS72282.1 YitT family protein [Paenalkalicoccus suaedae]
MKKQARRRNKAEVHTPVRRVLLDFITVLAGSAIVALVFNTFLLPNQIASGGVSGISTLFVTLFGFEPAFTQWAFNIPLFVAGILLLGGSLRGSILYGSKTLAGTLFLPFIVYVTRDVPPATTDPLLAAIVGGVGVGVGLGFVFRSNSSTGGTDLAAQIINKYAGLSLGACVFVIDGLVVVSSAFIFGLEFALYALIALFTTGKTIDIVQVGFGYSKMVIIISKYEEEVKQGLLTKVDRGVTKLAGFGGYTNHDQPVLMCVVGRNEVTKLKQLVQTIDPHAFVIVSDTSEVLGEGFKAK